MQLVKAYGGATTMLELTLPTAKEEAQKVGLRRSASRSAFQSFLNLEDAAAAQVVSLKVDPEVAARAEGALASLAGIAAVAEEGTGMDTRTEAPEPPPPATAAPVAQMPPEPMPHLAPFFGIPGMPSNPRGGGGGGCCCCCYRHADAAAHPRGNGGYAPSPDGTRRSNSRGSAGGDTSPCPPGVDPMLYAQHMGAAATAATAAASAAGPAGSSAAAAEFVSKFYSVLQSAVEHQQQTFMRMGASATCAERRAEAIARYLKKRKDRNFEKKVRYASRKRLAEARPRVRGQFVRLKEGEGAEAEDGDDKEGSGFDGSNENGSNEDGSTGVDGSNEARSNGGSNDGGSKENSASPRRRGGSAGSDK